MSEMKLLGGILIIMGFLFIGMRDKMIDNQTENSVLKNMYEYNIASGVGLILMGIVIIMYSKNEAITDVIADSSTLSTESSALPTPTAPAMLEQ